MAFFGLQGCLEVRLRILDGESVGLINNEELVSLKK